MRLFLHSEQWPGSPSSAAHHTTTGGTVDVPSDQCCSTLDSKMDIIMMEDKWSVDRLSLYVLLGARYRK